MARSIMLFAWSLLLFCDNHNTNIIILVSNNERRNHYGTSCASAFTPPLLLLPKAVILPVSQQRQEKVHLSIPTSTSTTRTRRHHNLAGIGIDDAWSSYLLALESNPLLVKSITAGVILGAADLSGQAIQQSLLVVPASTTTAHDDGIIDSRTTTSGMNKGKEDNEVGVLGRGSSSGVDIARFARFALFGFILQAPWNHFYYQILDGALPPTDDPFTSTTLIKVLIDQFIQAPIFTVIIFMFLGLLEGKSVNDIQRQLNEDYVDTMLANWKLWVPATAVNIAFCPPILRVLFLNVVFFFWSIFLSLKLNKSEEE